MDLRQSYRIVSAVKACRDVCIGSATPLTNYWLTIDLLCERIDWTKEEIDAFRDRFLESLLNDLEPSQDCPPIGFVSTRLENTGLESRSVRS